ncbi:T6SS immunity protein Tdi1 domain-containing protein [Bernardetia sp.]|uniref:T6SS immunity protein Tdi1 domain-containing protein n=1 Tax=Bernardetia sp. TaxID=1937974 RepID=UPI0025BC9379|nr:T6SS immunity protein Tdi1 domain-containing protein [Bernardetia sp.]
MNLEWSDFSIDFTHFDSLQLLESWKWLVGEQKKVILITSIGDLFYTDEKDRVYWLMTGQGESKKIADSLQEFEAELNSEKIFEEWFLPNLLKEIHQNQPKLTKGFLYGYKKIPTLGGEYEAQNYEITDIEVHFTICGQLQEKVQKLSNGVIINSIELKSK